MALLCNCDELTVTLSWQEPVHCVALTPAPGHLQSCSSSGGDRGTGCPKGQGFFSLHVHTQSHMQTHTLDLSYQYTVSVHPFSDSADHILLPLFQASLCI